MEVSSQPHLSTLLALILYRYPKIDNTLYLVFNFPIKRMLTYGLFCSFMAQTHLKFSFHYNTLKS